MVETLLSPNPYFLGFHFPTVMLQREEMYNDILSPNPYFLGFHFPTNRS